MSFLRPDSEFMHAVSLCADYIIPKPFDNRVAKAVSEAVAKAARDTGVARL